MKPIFDADREIWRWAVLLKTREFIFQCDYRQEFPPLLPVVQAGEGQVSILLFAVELEGEQHFSSFSYISYYSIWSVLLLTPVCTEWQDMQDMPSVLCVCGDAVKHTATYKRQSVPAKLDVWEWLFVVNPRWWWSYHMQRTERVRSGVMKMVWIQLVCLFQKNYVGVSSLPVCTMADNFSSPEEDEKSILQKKKKNHNNILNITRFFQHWTADTD